jgi:hypothetical protein
VRHCPAELAAVRAATAELAAAKGDDALLFLGQKHFDDTVISLEVRELWGRKRKHPVDSVA